jgi:hypothetical protein
MGLATSEVLELLDYDDEELYFEELAAFKDESGSIINSVEPNALRV